MMMPEEIGEEALAQEKVLVKNAKKIGILAAGISCTTFRYKTRSRTRSSCEHCGYRK